MVVDTSNLHKPNRPRNPFRQAITESIYRRIKGYPYGLLLDADEFKFLRLDYGFTRSAIESAINDLVEAGRVSVEPGVCGGLLVRAVEAVAKEGASRG